MDPRFAPVQPVSQGLDPMLALVLVGGAILLGALLCYVWLSGTSTPGQQAKVTTGGSSFVAAINAAKEAAIAKHAEELLVGIGDHLASPVKDLLPKLRTAAMDGSPVDTATVKK
jgi:hypothetical protein